MVEMGVLRYLLAGGIVVWKVGDVTFDVGRVLLPLLVPGVAL